MSLSSLFQSLRGVAGNLLAIWDFVCHAYQHIKDFFNHLLTLFGRIEQLISDVEDEIQQIKDFEFDPHWKTRVISVPRAYEKIHRLATEIPGEITTAIKDLVKQVKQRVEAGSGSTEDFDPADLEGDLKLVPEKLAKCGEKILGFVTLLFDTVQTISSVVDDLQTLVSDFREIRMDIENLDAIFLPSGSKKKTVDISYRKRKAM
jgi:hypothetical protein